MTETSLLLVYNRWRNYSIRKWKERKIFTYFSQMIVTIILDYFAAKGNFGMRKENKVLMWIAIILVVVGIGVAAGFAGYYYFGEQLMMEVEAELEEERVYEQIPSTKTAIREEYGEIVDLSGVVEEVMPSIVSITSTTTTTYHSFFGSYERDVRGSGSGIIFEVNEKELLIMTNNHVVEGAKEIQVTFIDDTMVAGSLKGTNPGSDLAVVCVDISELDRETKSQVKPAKLGDSTKSRVGEMVMAIGNALGYGQSVTVGYISARDRGTEMKEIDLALLQTDAAINPGNSGGALINLEGEVIGINSVKYAATAVEGMGYAIPMERALPIIRELQNLELIPEDQRGFLGIYYREVTEEMNRLYQIPLGLYVSDLSVGGPAEKAGLYPGDIITGIDDVTLTTTEELQEQMEYRKVGDLVTLTIQRYQEGIYEEVKIEVKLGEKIQ